MCLAQRRPPLCGAMIAARPRHSRICGCYSWFQERGEELADRGLRARLGKIVARHRLSRYAVENGTPPWKKIRSRGYSQMIARDVVRALHGRWTTRRVDRCGRSVGWGLRFASWPADRNR